MSPASWASPAMCENLFGWTLCVTCSDLDLLTPARLWPIKKKSINLVVLTASTSSFKESCERKKIKREERKARKERLVRDLWLMWNTEFFYHELKEPSRLPPRDPISGSLICRWVCIKNKAQLKLQSKKSVFRADRGTVCREQAAVTSHLRELSQRKRLKPRL